MFIGPEKAADVFGILEEKVKTGDNEALMEAQGGIKTMCLLGIIPKNMETQLIKVLTAARKEADRKAIKNRRIMRKKMAGLKVG